MVPRRNTPIRMTLRLALCGLVVASLLVGCKKTTEDHEPTKLVNVSVEDIQMTALVADTIEQPGVAMPSDIVTITAEVSGRVETVPVSSGDMVWAGDDPTVLVTLNTDLLQAECDGCEAEMTINKLRFDRIEELYERGGATEHERDQALANYQGVKSKYDAAKAKLERSTIVAPTSGTIDSLPVDEGEYLRPGDEIATIVNTNQMDVIVQVSERNVPFLKLGDHATIIAQQRGREVRLIGEITFIAKMLDSATFTSKVKIVVDNPDDTLRPGLVDVILTRQTLTDTIMVPLEVVVPRENDYVTYIIDTDVLMTLDIPAKAAEELEAGESTVTVGLPDGQSATPTIETVELSPYGKDYSRIQFPLDNTEGALVTGVALSVTLPDMATLELPLSEMHEATDEGGGEILFFSPRTARRVVALGLMQGTKVQILEGLEAGDRLIVTGQQYVGPGQPVRITKKIPDNSPDQPNADGTNPKDAIRDYHQQATNPRQPDSLQVQADPKGDTE
jgi:membrane fusion protein, multidrug efflux system